MTHPTRQNQHNPPRAAHPGGMLTDAEQAMLDVSQSAAEVGRIRVSPRAGDSYSARQLRDMADKLDFENGVAPRHAINLATGVVIPGGALPSALVYWAQYGRGCAASAEVQADEMDTMLDQWRAMLARGAAMERKLAEIRLAVQDRDDVVSLCGEVEAILGRE